MTRRSILHLRLADPGSTKVPGPATGGTTELLADFCRRTSPAWDLTPGGAYLDLTGTERMYGRGIDGAASNANPARPVPHWA